MVDVIISGEAGNIHAVYHKSDDEIAPLAVVLSGNPRAGYHMNDRISYAMFRAYMDIGFSVVRFNYRGVGESAGLIGTTADNMIDIATVIDWIQNQNEESDRIWLAGNHIGGWYALQAMMRRPEISGFTMVSPDYAISDFTFLSPRPNRGLLIQGALENEDSLVYGKHMEQILKKQAQIDLEIIKIKGACSKYLETGHLKQLFNEIKAYVGREKEDSKLL